MFIYLLGRKRALPTEFIQNLKKLEGENNVSNTRNPGGVPKGETAGELPGTKENGQTETVSSPNGGKSENGDQQSDNGQFDERSSGNGLSGESTGNPEPIPDTPRDTDARPLPVDHTIRENIYESGIVIQTIIV